MKVFFIIYFNRWIILIFGDGLYLDINSFNVALLKVVSKFQSITWKCYGSFVKLLNLGNLQRRKVDLMTFFLLTNNCKNIGSKVRENVDIVHICLPMTQPSINLWSTSLHCGVVQIATQ